MHIFLFWSAFTSASVIKFEVTYIYLTRTLSFHEIVEYEARIQAAWYQFADAEMLAGLVSLEHV